MKTPAFALITMLIVITGCQSAPSPTVARTTVPPTQTSVSPTATEAIIGGDPQIFLLALSDLPKGFTVANLGPVSNEDYAKEFKDPDKALAQVREWARLSGYATTFTSGPVAVRVNVGIYKTSIGARASFEDWDTRSKELGFALEPVSASKVGDESKAYTSAFTVQRGNNRIQVTGYTLVFRKANVLVAVTHTTTSGSTSLEETVNYAKIIEAKIR